MKNPTAEARAKHAEEQRRYRMRHPGKETEWQLRYRLAHLESAAEYNRQYKRKNSAKISAKERAKFPEKVAARQAVWRAIYRTGKLVRPSICESCGKPCRPEAHHDDYSKWLEVRWLCRSCHLAIDGRAERISRPAKIGGRKPLRRERT